MAEVAMRVKVEKGMAHSPVDQAAASFDVTVAVVVAQEQLHPMIDGEKGGMSGDRGALLSINALLRNIEDGPKPDTSLDVAKQDIAEGEAIELVNRADGNDILGAIERLLVSDDKEVVVSFLGQRAAEAALRELDRLASSETLFSNRARYVREVISRAFAQMGPEFIPQAFERLFLEPTARSSKKDTANIPF